MHAMLSNAKGFVITLVVSLLLFAKPVLGQEFTVNLKDTDIQEFIEFVADVTGTTIVIDPAVKGKVKVVSSKPGLARRAVRSIPLNIGRSWLHSREKWRSDPRHTQ